MRTTTRLIISNPIICLIILLTYASSAVCSTLDMMADISKPVVTEFAEYQPELIDITPSVEPYKIADDFSNVWNFDQFQFSDEQKRLLLENGFVAVQSDDKEMYEIYNRALKENTPIFVTVDALLHAFHEQFDYILRTLETDRFISHIQQMTIALIDGSLEQYNEAADSRVKEAARKNLAFFCVALAMLDADYAAPALVAELVASELQLIDAHNSMTHSPLRGYAEDYTQYVPRGHYTLSEDLKRYFRAMMWYGRSTFHNKETAFLGITHDMAEMETIQALLVTQLMNISSIGDNSVLDLWRQVYLPTVFFVGQSDNLNIDDYTSAALDVYGADFTTLPVDQFSDADNLDAFMNYPTRPASQISADVWGGGFSIMGQRFIPDSYIIDKLNFLEEARLPSGLDVMSVLGSERAKEILTQSGLYTEMYAEKHDKLYQEFLDKDESVWAQNVYWNWLYCLMPMLADKEEGFPFFMQNDAWRDKDLSCALGSWAELRHDTILYARPSAVGSADNSSNAYKSEYVEPNPWAFGRLASLVRYTIDGLNNLNLIKDFKFSDRINDLYEISSSLQTISLKELTNQPLTINECKFIRGIGDPLTLLCTIFDEEDDNYFPDVRPDGENMDDMSLIADIHTDLIIGEALEIGVGRPLTIYVIIGEGDNLSISVGSAFSYYEFGQPMNDRLTDEAWRKMLNESEQPPQPSWVSSYMGNNNTPDNIDKNDRIKRISSPVREMNYLISPSLLAQGENLTARFVFDATEIYRNIEYYEKYNYPCYIPGMDSYFVQIILGDRILVIELEEDVLTDEPFDYSAVINTDDWPTGTYDLLFYSPTNLAIYANKQFTVYESVEQIPTLTPTFTQTPTPTLTPIPTAPPNPVYMTDTMNDSQSIVYDFDPPWQRDIIIRWDFTKQYQSYMIMVKVNDNGEFQNLGETVGSENFFEWSIDNKYGQIIAEEFLDGPQLNTDYTFSIYGSNRRYYWFLCESFTFHYKIDQTAPTPTLTPSQTPTLTPTPTPTLPLVSVDDWFLYD